MCDVCGREGGTVWNNGLVVCDTCASRLPAFAREKADKGKLIRLCRTIVNTQPPEDCLFAHTGLKVGADSVMLDTHTPFCFPLSAVESINWEFLPREKLSEVRCRGELRALISFCIDGVQGYLEAYLTDNVTATVCYNSRGSVSYRMDDRMLPAIKSCLTDYAKQHSYKYWKDRLSDILMRNSQHMDEAAARLVLDLPPEGEIPFRELKQVRNRMIRLVHPDRGGSDGMLFRVNKAFQFLTEGDD